MINIEEKHLAAGTITAVRALARAGAFPLDLGHEPDLFAFASGTGINEDRLRRLLGGEEPFTLIDLTAIAQFRKRGINAVTELITLHAINLQYRPPAWATDTYGWEYQHGEYSRTNRVAFHESSGEGKTDLSVAVEQHETLGETPGLPVIDIYAQDQYIASPITWREAMHMGKGLIQASALLQELLVKAGDSLD